MRAKSDRHSSLDSCSDSLEWIGSVPARTGSFVPTCYGTQKFRFLLDDIMQNDLNIDSGRWLVDRSNGYVT